MTNRCKKCGVEIPENEKTCAACRRRINNYMKTGLKCLLGGLLLIASKGKIKQFFK